MSYRPQALGFLLRTGVALGLLPVSLRWSLYFSVKQGLDVPTRAAYSHSASVGRRTVTPFFSDRIRQNRWMSASATRSTGNFAPLLSEGFCAHHGLVDLLGDGNLRHVERPGQDDLVRVFVLIASLIERGTRQKPAGGQEDALERQLVIDLERERLPGRRGERSIRGEHPGRVVHLGRLSPGDGDPASCRPSARPSRSGPAAVSLPLPPCVPSQQSGLGR